MTVTALRACCCAAVLLTTSSALARDWFVREGASGGDGSKAKPFADPWQALDACEANDAVHVAEGKYFGRNRTGAWVLPFDGVKLIGGYDADFKERDPWKHRTELLWDKSSKNWPKDERILSLSQNTVVDGLVLDMREQNEYTDEAQTGRKVDRPANDAMRFSRAATVRNCVLVNPGANGITCPQGSTLENNLILNALGWGVVVNNSSNEGKASATVRDNTIAFSQDPKTAGTGRYQGAALALKGPAVVTNNLLVNSDNNAIYMTVLPEKVSLTRNVFFMNLFSNLKFGMEGRETSIDDKSMGDLDEVGLKAFEDNVVKNPQLELDPKWLDRYSRRTASKPGKVEMNDWNQVRQALGLTLIGTGGESASGVCPAYDLDKAYRLLLPKAAISAGARRKTLAVELQGGGASEPTKSYAKSELSTWVDAPAAVDGKALEVVLALGTNGANVSNIPPQYKVSEHLGAVLYEKGGEHRQLLGFFRKGSSAQRFVDDNAGLFTGTGTPGKLFVARGVAHALKGLPRTGFFIESIELDAGGGEVAARPAGRDWFVRAGASGGDGSKDKPFKDPWQALEKVEAGDTVHVAEGEYFGKLKVGKWKIDTTFISLVGGYDAAFTERNPWKHPTRLGTAVDFKGDRDGYTIEGAGDHTGAVVDGFVFDKKANNLYAPDGDLMYSQSPDKKEHIWFARPGCAIRNSVFLNGDEGALRVAGGQTIENNIFINHAYRTVRVERGFGGITVIRSNTLLFSWDPIHFGKGRGANGYLLGLEGGSQSVVDNNLFEFADNDAIRMAAEAKDVELTNNTFSKNLWSNVQRVTDWTAVDDREWANLSDLKFKKLSGNALAVSAVPLDKAWFDVYLGRVAPVPGKVQMNDWNQLRELLGQPVMATGSVAGSGFAPAYDWKQALLLFPKNAKVKSGARASNFPVQFAGVARAAAPAASYAEVPWETAKNRDAWAALEGKRVSLKVVLRGSDTTYQLDDVKKDDFQSFTVFGPEGIDSGGLPLRGYVKRGTAQERVVQQADSYSSGTPSQTYVISGVARGNRQLVLEAISRAD